ncbi:MAG: DUF4294 domain-containing protein [Lentimicrobiaceae bacterium]|nr:DUF4294 domain-containing protein [Lentimicrobiaceae bacterium]
MRKLLFILFIILLIPLPAQEKQWVVARLVVVDGDTMPMLELSQVNVFAPIIFKSKRDEIRFNRLMRNVKKVYPYAKLAGEKLNEYEGQLLAARSDTERKRLMRQAEDELKVQYGDELKNLTFSQGKILLKLVDRETGHSTFSLVQELRGRIMAFFWQSFARVFGYDLKVKYDPKGADKDIENIVLMIEAGVI